MARAQPSLSPGTMPSVSGPQGPACRGRTGFALLAFALLTWPALSQTLPEAPSALLVGAVKSAPGPIAGPVTGPPPAEAGSLFPPPQTTSPTRRPRCHPPAETEFPDANATVGEAKQRQGNCKEDNPVQAVVTRPVKPLTPMSKGLLAIRDVDDPFNLITLAGYSGVAIASNAHSAFGPGLTGWGRLTGYSLLEDAQGEFLGTFLIPSLVHEDPRYHRMPGAPMKRRVLHALAHTWVSQQDDGTPMPNYATLINYPVSAELANLYVPGIADNAPDTARRVVIGLATDPAGTLVAEFLPDLARHVHVHAIFVQEILNKVVTGGTAPNVQ